MTNKISTTIRRDISQTLKKEKIYFGGELNDVSFLSRIYDLDKMESTDDRYDSALGDIRTHRISFSDWEDDWVFSDARLDLMGCTDKKFLHFLCETIHGTVRPDASERKKLLDLYNSKIIQVGYKIEEHESEFGHKYYQQTGIFEQTIPSLKDIPDIDSKLNSDSIRKYVTRMETNIETNPELSIGTAKELVEGVLKTFLKTQAIEYSKGVDLPSLAKLAFNKIQETSDEKNEPKVNELTRQILRTLSNLVQNLSELRNNYGSGHGYEPDKIQLGPIYASLASNTAATLAIYIFKSYEKYFANNN